MQQIFQPSPLEIDIIPTTISLPLHFRFVRVVYAGESGARTSGEPEVRQGDDLYKVRGG